MEQGAFSANSQHHKLGKALGVCELALALENVAYAFIEPTRVKKMVTGNGRADKAELLDYMYRFSGIEKKKKLPYDISDAYALARVGRFIYLHNNLPDILYPTRNGKIRKPTTYQLSVIESVVINIPQIRSRP